MTAKATENREKLERAARLVHARRSAGYKGPREVCTKFHWNENTYKAHEAGRNGFGLADARMYADAFKVSLAWLNSNVGVPDDVEQSGERTIAVPILSMVSAGTLMQDDIHDEERGMIVVAGLADGDWIALEVSGNSMDRISPPGSKIIVNRRDKRLVPNACYVIADEDGSATYKRYRPNPARFEPVSTFEHGTLFPENEPTIIGRVKWSLLEM